MPAFVDTGLNLAHVDDVAQGHLLALRKGRIGERYILGGEDVFLSQMLADIAGMVGRKPPTVNLPRPRSTRWRSSPSSPPGSRPPAVCHHRRHPHVPLPDVLLRQEGRAELGYTARPYREGLSDAITWFRQAGYLG